LRIQLKTPFFSPRSAELGTITLKDNCNFAPKQIRNPAKMHDELARGQKHVRRNSTVQTNQKGVTDSEKKYRIIMPQALPYRTHEA